jgi:hypothetical protein
MGHNTFDVNRVEFSMLDWLKRQRICINNVNGYG